MELKVGDNIYTSDGTEKLTITRVTRVMAFANVGVNGYEIKFNKEYCESGWLDQIARPKFGSSYYIESEKLIKKYEDVGLRRKLSYVKLEKLSVDKVKRILDIIEEKEN